MISNTYKEKLGLFIIKMAANDPYKAKFIIKWMNKLDIGNTTIDFLRDPENGIKEMILSFKMIYINVYNVIVFDVTTDDNSVMHTRHESFQLWESEINGILLAKSHDFITLNKDGISVVALGTKEKKQIRDSEGQIRMLHSLDSCSYLKISPSNYLVFECAKLDKRVVSIQQEFMELNDLKTEETSFERVYNIKISDITLRELILFQSIYLCKTETDIFKIIKMQPNPSVFYKTCLEFDGTNMTSILSFDNRSIAHLLDDQYEDQFDE